MTESMRVCMLLEDSYPPDVRVRKEAKTLEDAGHEVVLLCDHEDGQPRHERVGPVDVVRVPVFDTYGRLTDPRNAAWYLGRRVNRPWERAIADLYETRQFDVLHVHDLPLVRTALRWQGDRPVPVVADLHENWPEAKRQYRSGERLVDRGLRGTLDRLSTPVWRLKRIERACVSSADRVVAVVEEGKAHYVNDCGADPDDVAVVPNYVDTEWFPGGTVTPAPVDGEFVLLYVGTIGGRHRGLETVLRAMPAVAERVADPLFLVVGSGSHVSRLRDLSRSLGITDVVEFAGWVDFEDLPAYVAASDVGLVPHRDNPHTATTVPHKLTQYMALGTPPLVSDVEPLARIVSDTAAGLVFPAGDPDGLAEAATDLAADADQRARLGANARRAVQTEYNWETASVALRDLYDDLSADAVANATAPPR